jgi:hypothetical protein
MAGGGMLEKIKEQEWAQQIMNAWSQLPPDQQRTAQIGGTVLGLLAAVYLMFSTYDAAQSAKQEYYQKEELSRILNQASDELRRLKGQNAGIGQGGPQSWNGVFEGMASMQGLPPGSVEILKDSAGPAIGLIQESLVEIKVKGLQIRQLVSLLYQVEHGSPPMKLKGMIIEPGGNEGLLNAKLNVSGYMAKPEKGDKGK